MIDGEIGYSYPERCPKCRKRFEVTEIEQVPGFRFPEELVCPYCGETIKTSMEVEYMTRRMEYEDKAD